MNIEYNIPVSNGLRKDAVIMCKLSTGIEERAKHQVEKRKKITYNKQQENVMNQSISERQDR